MVVPEEKKREKKAEILFKETWKSSQILSKIWIFKSRKLNELQVEEPKETHTKKRNNIINISENKENSKNSKKEVAFNVQEVLNKMTC